MVDGRERDTVQVDRVTGGNVVRESLAVQQDQGLGLAQATQVGEGAAARIPGGGGGSGELAALCGMICSTACSMVVMPWSLRLSAVTIVTASVVSVLGRLIREPVTMTSWMGALVSAGVGRRRLRLRRVATARLRVRRARRRGRNCGSRLLESFETCFLLFADSDMAEISVCRLPTLTGASFRIHCHTKSIAPHYYDPKLIPKQFRPDRPCSLLWDQHNL